ncbi:MAG: hypothetical protein RLZZ618_812 [Pseudomonadota bacterium]|jgi:type III secretion protein C
MNFIDCLSMFKQPGPALGRGIRVAALLCAAAVASTTALAAPVPYGDRRIQLVAREQPIAAFLQDLFGLIDLPVSVSPSVKGAVNGTFNGEAESITRSISRAFGLTMYYDGAVMHVYTAGEMVARTLPTTPAVADKVLRAAADMRLADNRNTVRRTTDGAIIASGTRRFIEQVEELTRASQVSQAVQPPMGFKVFYLRYAWAQDVTVNFGGRQVMVPGVATTIRSLVTSSPRSQASLAAQEQQQRPTQPKLKGQGMGRTQPVLGMSDSDNRPGTADVLMAAYGGNAGGGNYGGGYAGGGGAPLVLGDLQQVRIEADTRLNAVIVRDAPERLPFYEQLIASLDVEPQSLEIEATIIDINTDRLRELGVNWRGNIGKSSVLFGNGTQSDTLLQPGGSIVGSAITPSALGGVVSAVLGDASQFVARISAMQSEGAARVVSSPQVVTLSNVEAIFDSSTTFYVRVAGRDEVDLFNVSAGTSLRVTPHVFKDTQGVRIKLLVNLEDGSLSNERVDAIPVVSRSSINTQALIYEGESLLIGGLTRESSGSGVDKVPFLGDIPLLGRLFKTQRDSGARIERMFLISPRLSARRSAAMGPAPLPVAPVPAERQGQAAPLRPASGLAPAPVPTAPVRAAAPALAPAPYQAPNQAPAPAPVPDRRAVLAAPAPRAAAPAPVVAAAPTPDETLVFAAASHDEAPPAAPRSNRAPFALSANAPVVPVVPDAEIQVAPKCTPTWCPRGDVNVVVAGPAPVPSQPIPRPATRPAKAPEPERLNIDGGPCVPNWCPGGPAPTPRRTVSAPQGAR